MAIKRNQVQIPAKRINGKLGVVDPLNLDDDSFRAWVIHQFIRMGVIQSRDLQSPDLLNTPVLELKEKRGL